ncbi:MAG: HYR domain-containing protein [Saprospirales bacterium]|nr:HYR domain-containing protein [Saprospirales bacterium]
MVGQGANNNQTGEYTGYNGSYYFAGEDLKDVGGNGSPDGLDEKEILFTGIDISNETGLQFKGLFAAGAETPCGASTYDAADFIKVFYSVDNGPFVLGMCFHADIYCSNPGNTINEPLHLDPNCDGDGGEGAMLGNAFQEFSFPLPSGTSLDIKVVVSADGNGEEMAFDYFRVVSAGVLPCVDPVVVEVTKSGDACQPGQSITLTVLGDLNDATNWYWYTDGCGQTQVGTGTSIVVNPAMTTTYYVRGEPGCDGPLPCTSITVNVGMDTTPPDITCPANQVVPGGANCSAALGSYVAQAVVSDNCDPEPVVTQSPVAGTNFFGSVVVTLSAEDASGNVGTCTFLVSVQDNIAPVLSLPADVTLECGESEAPPAETCGPMVLLRSGLTISLPASGSMTLQASQFDAASEDGCGTGNLTFSFSPNPVNTSKVYNCTHVGTHAVNIWAIDGNGHKHSATASLVVQDPFGYCPNGGNGCQPVPVLYSMLVVSLQPDGSVTLDASSWDAGSMNVCQSGNLTFSFSSNTNDQTQTFTCTDLTGIQSLDIWVTDGSNNQSRASVALLVQDQADYCSAPSGNCGQLGLLKEGVVLNLPPNRVGVLSANIFDAGSEDACNTGGLNFAFVNPNPAPAKSYTCDNLGVQVEQIRVIDGNGSIAMTKSRNHIFRPNHFRYLSGSGGHYPYLDCHRCGGQLCKCESNYYDRGYYPPVVVCPDDQNEPLGPGCAFTVPNYVGLLTAGDECSASLSFEQLPATGQILNTSSPITLTVSDDCQNTTVCIFQLILTDEGDPVVSCPGNQEATPNGNCAFELEDYTGLAQASDNCDSNLDITQSPAAGTILTQAVTVTITATDDTGNTGTCTFEVTVGSLSPEFSATPNNITVNCASDVPGNQGVQAFDDCDGQIQVFFTQTGLPLNCPGAGTVTNTWTATDSDGHTITHTQIVTVADGIAPVLSSLPSDITVSCLGDVPGNQGITAMDNCEGLLTPVFIQSAAPPCAGVGIVTNTWLAQDCVGNSTVHIQTVTIVDNAPPVFNNPPQNITVSCSGDVPAAQGLTATDNCGGTVPVVFAQSILPICPGQGVVTNTWTATDCAGNSAVHTQTVTIEDNQAPVLSAYPASGTATCMGDVPGNPGLTATDNCGGTIAVSFSQNINSSCPGSGVVTNTWTAVDCAGNTEVYAQIIAVDDNDPPVFSAYPVDLTVTCISDVPGDPGITASDNCGGSIDVVFTQNLPGSCTGVATNTWTSVDCAGNTATYTQVVTISDNVPPVFSAYPASLTVSCASQVPGNQGVTGIDNCGGPVSVAYSQSPIPPCAGQGLVTNTWTATDCAGNTATWMQIVTIDDNTAPVLSAQPANLTVACAADIPGAQGVTASDNCGGAINVVFTQTGLPLSYPNPGVVTNTWVATDCAGNSTTHAQFITIDDNIAPVALCKNITVNLSVNGEVTITPFDVNNGSSDNCGIASYSVNPALFSCEEVGVFPAVLTVMDLFENTASCTAYVNVVASFICPEPGISYYGGPTVSDPCTCLGNGQFEEEVVVGPTGPGQIWTVATTTLLNPNTMLPYPAGTPLVEHSLGGGQSIYTLVGIHLDGVGYSIQVASPSWPGLLLSLSNVCYYPDPQIIGLDGPFCIYSDPITLEGDVGGVALESEGFTIDGDPATVFDPFDLGVGNYLVEYTVDAGTAAPGDPADPGCVASTSQMVQVLQTPSTLACNDLITVGVDGNCEALITPDMILEGPIYAMTTIP